MLGAGVAPIGERERERERAWGPGPPAPGWHVSQRFVNAEGFPIVLIPPPLHQLSLESRHIPRLSDLTHHPPFGAQLASLGCSRRPSHLSLCIDVGCTHGAGGAQVLSSEAHSVMHACMYV